LGIQRLETIAKETGFGKRRSKLSPSVFFDLVFYAMSLSRNTSLEYQVSFLESKYGIELCKQSLDERFNEKTVKFVRGVLSGLIKAQLKDHLYSESLFSTFNHVRIKDSTKFNVPANLSEHYKGSGGSGNTSPAGISIQYEFDLKTGESLSLEVTEAVRNDQRDAGETAGQVCENDLVIRDLGYFSTHSFEEIARRKAFFLSRLHSNTIVYDENNVEIDFKQLYAFMSKNGIKQLEKSVFIGKDRLPVRLIIGVVPEEVYEQRIRHKQKEGRKRGRQMSGQMKFLCHFNFFMTNAEEEKLPLDKIMPLYRFRWQVELMFKNWKSVFSIHSLQKMKEHRYITLLYIRLILILLNLQIVNRLQYSLSKRGQTERILSYKKTLQTLKDRFPDLLNILRSNREEAIKSLGNIFRILSKKHWREKRKKRENFCENIFLFNCISKE
jgi:hypothetical protein